MARKAVVDKEACIGCGLCAETCPEIFFIGEDGKAAARPGATCSHHDVQETAALCPVEAISVEGLD